MADRVALFDGETSEGGMPEGWRMAGPGSFEVVEGALESQGGMGLLWYSARAFADFVLDLDWQVARRDDNSGVFVRFPDVGDDPWVEGERGLRDPDPRHRTGTDPPDRRRVLVRRAVHGGVEPARVVEPLPHRVRRSGLRGGAERPGGDQLR